MSGHLMSGHLMSDGAEPERRCGSRLPSQMPRSAAEVFLRIDDQTA